MGHRLIRVSTRRTGERRIVRVYVYDTVEEMRAAGQRFNGNDQTGAWGLTQCYADAEGRARNIIVRLCRESLGTTVVCHEVAHASQAIYGSMLDDTIDAREHLNHYNETFAYIHSDLEGSLVKRLYALGYYSREA